MILTSEDYRMIRLLDDPIWLDRPVEVTYRNGVLDRKSYWPMARAAKSLVNELIELLPEMCTRRLMVRGTNIGKSIATGATTIYEFGDLTDAKLVRFGVTEPLQVPFWGYKVTPTNSSVKIFSKPAMSSTLIPANAMLAIVGIEYPIKDSCMDVYFWCNEATFVTYCTQLNLPYSSERHDEMPIKMYGITYNATLQPIATKQYHIRSLIRADFLSHDFLDKRVAAEMIKRLSGI